LENIIVTENAIHSLLLHILVTQCLSSKKLHS